MDASGQLQLAETDDPNWSCWFALLSRPAHFRRSKLFKVIAAYLRWYVVFASS